MLLTIYLLLKIGFCQDYNGTILTNSSFSMSLNYTQNTQSIILQFLLPNSSSNIVCIASSINLKDLIIDPTTFSIYGNKTIFYDYQGYISNSQYQLIQMNYVSTLNINCLQLNSSTKISIDFSLSYSVNSLVKTCINDCNGYSYPQITDSVCIAEACHCLDNVFGYFCQFPSQSIDNNVPTTFTLYPQEWKWIQYKFTSTKLILKTDNTDGKNIYFGFALQSSPQYDFPNLQDSYKLSVYFNLQDLIESKQTNTYCDVIYIGLVNMESYQLQQTFSISNEDSGEESSLEKNKVVIIVTGCIVGSLLLFAFGLSILKSRQQRQFELQIQQVIRENIQQVERLDFQQREQQRIADKKNFKGFSLRFIQDHFKGHSYDKIIKVYTGLVQFEDCTVCLESMKNGRTKTQRQCSVTPCFHIFHNRCLEEWLIRQKNCPFCRTELTRKKIIKEYPWLEVHHLKVNNTESTYLSRMKLPMDSINESSVNLMQQNKEVESPQKQEQQEQQELQLQLQQLNE